MLVDKRCDARIDKRRLKPEFRLDSLGKAFAFLIKIAERDYRDFFAALLDFVFHRSVEAVSARSVKNLSAGDENNRRAGVDVQSPVEHARKFLFGCRRKHR